MISAAWLVDRKKGEARYTLWPADRSVYQDSIRNLLKGKRCQMWFIEGKRLGGHVIYLERIAEGGAQHPLLSIEVFLQLTG